MEFFAGGPKVLLQHSNCQFFPKALRQDFLTIIKYVKNVNKNNKNLIKNLHVCFFVDELSQEKICPLGYNFVGYTTKLIILNYLHVLPFFRTCCHGAVRQPTIPGKKQQLGLQSYFIRDGRQFTRLTRGAWRRAALLSCPETSRTEKNRKERTPQGVISAHEMAHYLRFITIQIRHKELFRSKSSQGTF